MSIHDELGIKRIINASATLTRLGGSVMPPEVLAAMQDAASSHVDLPDFHARIAARLAQLTHNEAAFITSGAAAGIAVAVSACVAGADRAKMAQLPDTTGMRNEVIVHKSHRNGYDHAVRMVGVKVVEIGSALDTQAWELESAINANTAAVVWFQGGMSGHADLPLAKVIEIASARNVPVIVDAAAQLPPVENLWKFTEMGATAAIFSGGKDLRGPQSSGLVVGRKSLLDVMHMHTSPNHSLGRPMKVGKEEMAGLLAAVTRYLNLDHAARADRDERVVADWCRAFNGVRGVCAERSFPNEAGQPLPRVALELEPDVLGVTRDQVIEKLMAGDPGIAVAPGRDNTIYLNPMTLTDDEVGIVQARVLQALRPGA